MVNLLCACGCGQEFVPKFYWNEKRRNYSKFIRGHNTRLDTYSVWNKGLTKETDIRIKTFSDKTRGKFKIKREVRHCKCGCGKSKAVKVNSSWMFLQGHSSVGRKGWSFGLTKETDKRIKNFSERMIRNNPMKNPIIKAKRGNPLLGRRKENYEYLRIAALNRIGKNPFKNKIHPMTLRTGSSHWWWKGGISYEPYGIEFNKNYKAFIKLRDGQRCFICNGIKLLCVHHINYNKKDNCNFNLITLCNKCHSKTNNDRQLWEDYFIGSRLGKRIVENIIGINFPEYTDWKLSQYNSNLKKNSE